MGRSYHFNPRLLGWTVNWPWNEDMCFCWCGSCKFLAKVSIFQEAAHMCRPKIWLVTTDIIWIRLDAVVLSSFWCHSDRGTFGVETSQCRGSTGLADFDSIPNFAFSQWKEGAQVSCWAFLLSTTWLQGPFYPKVSSENSSSYSRVLVLKLYSLSLWGLAMTSHSYLGSLVL